MVNQQSRSWRRRGITSVLAMMFLVLFASVVTAMAVVADGNVRTAESAVSVSRAISAAESGLHYAARRLRLEAARYIIERGTTSGGFGARLWDGTWTPSDGTVLVSGPQGYTVSSPSGTGLLHAVHDAHEHADDHGLVLDDGTPVSLELNGAEAWMRSPGIPLHGGGDAPWFRLRYEWQDDAVLVTSQGHERDIVRTLTMRFDLEKKIEFALLSPTRIMIGKNVTIDGPVGTFYGTLPGELTATHGDPLVVLSDFSDVNIAMDIVLNNLQAQILAYDVDGDNRLRPDHPTESNGLTGGGLTDRNGDGYVDDLDIFLTFYDADGDGTVVHDQDLAFLAGHGALPEEFTDDPQLGTLLDGARPDRNDDGVIDALDTAAGWNDGRIDALDQYAKIKGELSFAVDGNDWESARGGPWQTTVQGPVDPGALDVAATFNVGSPHMVEITNDMFSNSTTWFESTAAASPSFSAQVASNGGWSGETTDPETVPFGSIGAYDLYDRPVYRNMQFTNVVIPRGTNALFEDCTFLGVTWIDTEEQCTNPNWNYLGSREYGQGGVIQERFEELPEAPGFPALPTDTKAESNNIRFESCTFLGSIAGERPLQYTHWRNKVQLTGDTRIFIDPDDPDLLAQPDGGILRMSLYGISESDREELAKSTMMLPG
ncbi:MAG: hypothetical protein MK095_09445, partial [Phycisphaerales bacterium]|nr:hypothetical protein [Phycisphaerales bacterium]